MLYDGRNPFHAASARSRLEKLVAGGKMFDLTERRAGRGMPQNRYLHACLSYFALRSGETAEYVKREYYKRLCNRECFVREREDRWAGRTEYLRSSADLDSGEMSATIERFRNWASSAAGIYIPAPEEWRAVLEMEAEVQRGKAWL